jgi:hypothetical protein
MVEERVCLITLHIDLSQVTRSTFKIESRLTRAKVLPTQSPSPNPTMMPTKDVPKELQAGMRMKAGLADRAGTTGRSGVSAAETIVLRKTAYGRFVLRAWQWVRGHTMTSLVLVVGILSAALAATFRTLNAEVEVLNLEVHDHAEGNAMIGEDDLEEHGTFKPKDGTVDLI